MPITSPYIYQARAIDYSTISIIWGKISQKEARGILCGYRIYYHSLDYKYYFSGPVRNITVGPDILEARISGLQSYTNYIIWVKAFTSKGEGSDKYERWIRTSKSSFFDISN